MIAAIGHNSRAGKPKYTAADIDAALRCKIREDNIREDSTYMQKVKWELWLSRLSPRAKLVGLAIWEHADKDGANAFPSMKRLLVMVGGSKRDLSAAIDEFAAWEFSEVVEGTGRRANEYRFHLTIEELSDHLSGNIVVPQANHSGTSVVPQEAHCSGTTEVPHEEFVVPKSAVVVPSNPRSGTIPSISTRAFDLVDLSDLKKKDTDPDGSGAEAPETSLRELVWTKCITWLLPRSCLDEVRLRQRVGRWVQEFGAGAVIDAVAIAQKEAPVSIMAYVEGVLRRKARPPSAAKIVIDEREANRRKLIQMCSGDDNG